MRELPTRTGKVMIASEDGEWHELGVMPAPGTHYVDAGIGDDATEILQHKAKHTATYSAKVPLQEVSPALLALVYGGWVAGPAKDELLWRVNQHWRGRDPGKPKNWPGLTDETRGRVVPRRAILRASTDTRRTNA